jgi:hypothetical protein
MTDRILELARRITGTAKNQPVTLIDEQITQFARLLAESMVAQMQVEGSDFYYNKPNNYGCITVKFFTGPGNPNNMRGTEVMARFAPLNQLRGTGSWRLNTEFAAWLIDTIKLDNHHQKPYN